MRTFLLTLTLIFASLAGARAEGAIQDGDVLQIAIGGVPAQYTGEFNIQFIVSDGTVAVPHIGRIRVAGLTASQLGVAIEKRFKDDKIFTNPSVIVNPIQSPRTLVIGGAVRNPGRQPWNANMTLKQAIASAAGFAEFADDKIKLVRGGKEQLHSRKAISKDPALDPKVFPNDYIEVQGEF